jgi:hypothetical protein
MPERLDSDNLVCYFDVETGIGRVTYKGVVTPEVTQTMYGWGMRVAREVDVKTVRGTIYDFREVKRFELGTLSTVHKESQRANQSVDWSQMATALLVSTPQQEQMVRVAMSVTPGQQRKKIVYSVEEALQFIDSFHPKPIQQPEKNDTNPKA